MLGASCGPFMPKNHRNQAGHLSPSTEVGYGILLLLEAEGPEAELLELGAGSGVSALGLPSGPNWMESSFL